MAADGSCKLLIAADDSRDYCYYHYYYYYYYYSVSANRKHYE